MVYHALVTSGLLGNDIDDSSGFYSNSQTRARSVKPWALSQEQGAKPDRKRLGYGFRF